MPERISSAAEAAIEEHGNAVEIRVRLGRELMLITPLESFFILSDGRTSSSFSPDAVKPDADEINCIFNRLSHYSVYSYKESLNSGFITLSGGGRVGIGSSAVCREGEVCSVRDISSFNFRIAGVVPECADEILKVIYERQLVPTLIIGSPCSGKTTVLREISRKISSGYKGKYLKVSIIDERNEIASMCSGVPLFDVGINTDVMSGFPKDKGTICALRTLSPDVIILDEIGTEAEAQSILEGLNTGVKFIASAHAANFEEALKRPQIRSLTQSGAFGKMVLLGNGKNLGKAEEFKDL